MCALYVRQTSRDSSGKIVQGRLQRVGYAARAGGGYERTAGGAIDTTKGSLIDERIRQENKANRPENIPGAIASTVMPDGRPGVITGSDSRPPSTIPERAAMLPSIVASSRRGQNEFITNTGERANLIASVKSANGGWAVGLKTQEAPRQTVVPPAFEPKQYPRTIRGVSSRAADGYGYLSDKGSSLQLYGDRKAREGKENKEFGKAFIGAQAWGLGGATRGVGNLGQAYFGQKASMKTEGGAAFSYGVDVLSPGAGKFVAGKFLTPIVNRGATAFSARYGTAATAKATEYFGAGTLGLGIFGTTQIARASQNKESSRMVTSPFAVPIAGFAGGALEGVYGAKTFGLKRTAVTRQKTGVTDQLGGAVGFGETVVPRGTLQASNVQKGTVTYNFFGQKIKTNYQASKSYQLLPNEKGLLTGKSYVGYDTTNPLTGAGVSSRQTLFAAGRGRNLVEVSPSKLSGTETLVTYQRRIGKTGFGETIVQTRGKTRSFEADKLGGITFGKSVKRASVAQETVMRQGSRVVQTPESRAALGGTSGVLDPNFYVLRQFSFQPGKTATRSSGVAGAYPSARTRGTYGGVAIARQAGMLPPKATKGISGSRRGSILDQGILDAPTIQRPGTGGTPWRGSNRLGGAGGRSVPELAGISLGSFAGVGAGAGVGALGLFASNKGRTTSNPSITNTRTDSFQIFQPIQQPSQRISSVTRQAQATRLGTQQLTVSRLTNNNTPLVGFPTTPNTRFPILPGAIAGFPPIFGGDRRGKKRGTPKKGKKKDAYASSLTAGILGLKSRGKKKNAGFLGIEVRGL